MKSRKIVLIAFLVIVSAIGFTTLQENVFVENQVVDISETSSEANQVVDISDTDSEVKTIAVSISDGVGFGDTG